MTRLFLLTFFYNLLGTDPNNLSVVRHPMYSGAYFIILFTPLALGSFLEEYGVRRIWGQPPFPLNGDKLSPGSYTYQHRKTTKYFSCQYNRLFETSSSKQVPGLIPTPFNPENDPFFWNYKFYFQN